MDMQKAKELYFRYDGSRFYMSRDGTEEAYLKAGVAPEVEAIWLEELKREKLRLLADEGNWMVIHFFLNRGDLGHLADFIRAEPRGVLCERGSFLDKLLKYARAVRKAGRETALVHQAVRKTILEAERLLKTARSVESIRRIHAVILLAQDFLREVEAD